MQWKRNISFFWKEAALLNFSNVTFQHTKFHSLPAIVLGQKSQTQISKTWTKKSQHYLLVRFCQRSWERENVFFVAISANQPFNRVSLGPWMCSCCSQGCSHSHTPTHVHTPTAHFHLCPLHSPIHVPDRAGPLPASVWKMSALPSMYPSHPCLPPCW